MIIGKPCEYEVIEGRSMHDLVESVNAHIEAGWLPQGGICVVQYVKSLAAGSMYRMWYAQAVVRYEEELDEADS